MNEIFRWRVWNYKMLRNGPKMLENENKLSLAISTRK
jgi:hypothetical protein